MSKLEMIVLSGVIYRIKSTGPSTEPCGTPYESVTLSAYLASKKKTKFDTAKM